MLQAHNSRPQLISRSDLLPLTYLILAGTAIIAIYGARVGFNELHLLSLESTVNDQATYYTAAKRILNGHLESFGLYPATAAQDFQHNYLYMPGHVLVTALSFSVFGVNAFAAFLPNILAYLFAGCSVYLLGKRFGSAGVGVIASAIFMLFPMNIVYALSCMAEMTFLGAILLAMLVFYNSPAKYMPWVAPLCLIFPFFFRESAILLAVPFAIYIYAYVAEYDLKKALLPATSLLLACFIMFVVLMSIEPVANRPSIALNTLLLGGSYEKYTNAIVAQLIPSSLTEWWPLIYSRLLENVGAAIAVILKDPTSLQSFSLVSPLLVALASPFIAWKNTRVRGVALQVAGLSLILCFCLTFIYHWAAFIGVRQLLMVIPLQAVMLAILLQQIHSSQKMMSYAAATALLALFFFYSTVAGKSIIAEDAKQETLENIVDGLDILDGTVIVGDMDLSVIYGMQKESGYVSFPPWNQETLDLLNQRFPITGSFISEDWLNKSESLRSMLDTLDFEYKGTIPLNEKRNIVYHVKKSEHRPADSAVLKGAQPLPKGG